MFCFCTHIYEDALLYLSPAKLGAIQQTHARTGTVFQFCAEALLAWDLTSSIHGCHRVPLTVVTERGGAAFWKLYLIVKPQANLWYSLDYQGENRLFGLTR